MQDVAQHQDPIESPGSEAADSRMCHRSFSAVVAPPLGGELVSQLGPSGRAVPQIIAHPCRGEACVLFDRGHGKCGDVVSVEALKALERGMSQNIAGEALAHRGPMLFIRTMMQALRDQTIERWGRASGDHRDWLDGIVKTIDAGLEEIEALLGASA